MPVGPLSQPGGAAKQPDKPTSVSPTATAGTNSASAGAVNVAFTPSTNPGKGAANYIATSNPGPVTASAASSPIIFVAGSLTRGQAYTFTIIKQSTSGISSDVSSSSNPVTPFTIPQAPGLSLATGDSWGARAIRVTYSAPANNGGSAITSYQYSTDGSTWTTAAASPFTLTNHNYGAQTAFANNETVTVRVRAVNAAGSGDVVSSAATTPALPGAPTSLSMTNTDNTVDWTWAEPTSNGGLSITSYEYSVSTNNAAFPGNSPLTNPATWFAYPGSIDNYKNTNYYKLQVRAVTAAGAGPYATSGNSTSWTLSTGNNVTETTYGPYTTSGCSRGCCNSCGDQGFHRRKYSQRTTRTDTYTRGASTATTYNVITNFTGDPDGDGVVDWGSVPDANYLDCSNDGTACSTTARATYNAAYDGQVLNTACGYRTWSSFFGAWAVSDASGNFTGPTGGNTGSGCGSQACYVFSETITYCPNAYCSAQYECTGFLVKGSCCGFLGCYPVNC